jgi:hypothetical protein
MSEYKQVTTGSKIVIQKPNIRFQRLAILSGLAMALPLLAIGGTGMYDYEHDHGGHDRAPAKLVEIVRDATRQFFDVNSATYAHYEPFLGCVTGPDRGAMGIHYVNMALVGDGEIDAMRPEALIYEPLGDRRRLVGVEYIVDAKTWLKYHDGPPVLEGQSFQFVPSPNRFALPSFFELHVWAWRHNPHGAFVDWNTRVTCEGL